MRRCLIGKDGEGWMMNGEEEPGVQSEAGGNKLRAARYLSVSHLSRRVEVPFVRKFAHCSRLFFLARNLKGTTPERRIRAGMCCWRKTLHHTARQSDSAFSRSKTPGFLECPVFNCSTSTPRYQTDPPSSIRSLASLRRLRAPLQQIASLEPLPFDNHISNAW